ncbi:DUF1493 family protein [Pseudoduganella violacea]|uniref:DUF1493 family protein n=1 Tax=Pseudoduganella violacea TaxID=1715466 RepID=A0A7W5BEP5_9BURK|nr:DUF1493 family protein [Pseudoduganella violacea]MBB3121772.1 hypothetical protein [Pseudoduganella violacea]
MSGLTPVLINFLKLCGLRQSRIDNCDLNTRLYHDLGIYGEVAEGCMEVLVNAYQVDMTNFDFKTYFPLEFPGKTGVSRFLLWQIPFARRIVERKADYSPLTLGMIEAIIHSKQWPSSCSVSNNGQA